MNSTALVKDQADPVIRSVILLGASFHSNLRSAFLAPGVGLWPQVLTHSSSDVSVASDAAASLGA